MAESTTSSDVKRLAYWNALQKTLSARYPSFVEALRGQTLSQQHQGRAAIVKFRESEEPCVERINSREELQTRLSDSLEKKGIVQRHLYIIEDLGRAIIELLGSRLGVSPFFFANHWEQPDSRTPMVDGSTLIRDRRQSFKLVFPGLYAFKSTEGKDKFSSGQYVDSKSNVLRGVEILDVRKEFETCSHQMSFWSLIMNSESWIGVLLVDPPITEARLSYPSSLNDSLGQVDHVEPPPFLLHLQIVDSMTSGSPLAHFACFSPIECNDVSRDSFEAPVLKSTFDNLLYFYDTVTSPVSKDPISAMVVSQRYVLQVWNGYLRSRMVTFWRDSKGKGAKSYSGGSGKIWVDSWDWVWREEIYQRLTRVKTIAQLRSKDIKYNMQVLGIDTKHTVLEESDIEGWIMLREEMASLREGLNNLIEAYVQTSTLQESQIANAQARDIGRLTKVATILLPLTVCTGIFSMSGNFLPGESKFWVFWLWAVPCVLAFTSLVFVNPLRLMERVLEIFTGILARLRDMCARASSLRSGQKKAGLGTPKSEA